MKKVIILLAVSIAFILSAQAKGKKVDWSLCEQEISAHCTKAKSDHDKHECIEKLPKGKVSDECREKNEKLEGTFGKHDHDHK